MLTNQEVFDTVAKHLFAQGKPASSFDAEGEPDGCFYRGPDGTKCAVGCLIPDDQYDASFEGTGVYFISPRPPALIGMSIALIAELQSAHDVWPNWQDEAAMKSELAAIAYRHGLSDAVLETLSFSRPTEG